jgi:(4-O-methyl)-D-glucuronate---lignin esterase
VQAGGILIGVRPLRSQGVVPETDARKFAQIVDALWTACEKSADHHVTIDKGQLFCIESSRDALKAINLSPDFEAPPDQTASLDYIHRRSPDTDIYFIRNTQPKSLQTSVTLRVDSRQPEIFDAVTGEVHQTLLFTATADHRISVSLALEPYGSVFLLFRHPAAKNNVTRIARDGTILYSGEHPNRMSSPFSLTVENESGTPVLHTPDPGAYEVTFANGQVTRVNAERAGDIPLSRTWSLAFPPDWGAPSQLQLNSLQSWTESTDAGVRYFSGTATYRTTVNLTGSQLAGKNSLWLDLGEVHEVAAVRINGKPAAILWKAPYSLRADPLLRAGENTVEIDVTNLWPNRLIGDAQSPNGKHYTWTNIRKYTKVSPLLPSGLLGPVALHPLYRLPLRP